MKRKFYVECKYRNNVSHAPTNNPWNVTSRNNRFDSEDEAMIFCRSYENRYTSHRFRVVVKTTNVLYTQEIQEVAP